MTALAPATHAQNVTLSGLIDLNVGSFQYAGDQRVARVNSGGMTTTWWGLSGAEDLGGGLKVTFKINGFFRADTGEAGRFGGNETLFSRDAVVALEGGFGRLAIGRELAPNFLPTVAFNAFRDSFAFSPLVLHANVPLFNATGWASVNAGDTGWSNQLRYTSPNFGGATFNFHYQFGEVAGNSGNRNVGANVLYFGNPVSLAAFYHAVRANNPGPGTVGSVKLGASKQEAWMVSARFNAGFANFYANYQATDHNIAAESKTWSLSADAALGPGKVLLAHADTKWEIGATQKKRATTSVGYNYDLSKRSDIYAVALRDRVRGFNTGTTVALGMRHRF